MSTLRTAYRLLRLLQAHPSSIRDFGRLTRSVTRGATALDDQIPWITYDAFRWLSRFIRPDSRVFEWGSGGSTLFFAQRVQSVVAIEHDPQWHARVTATLHKMGATNCRCLLVPSENPAIGCDSGQHIPGRYHSDHPGYEDRNFGDYCRVIEQFPSNHFDIIVVDGRARTSCVFHARRFLANGGALILDNADRASYGSAISLVDARWTQRVFRGVGPYNLAPWMTMVWIKQ